MERALRAGALGYVMKRESTGQIVAAIRQVQEGKLFADPAVLAQLTQRMVGRTAGTGENAVDLLSDRELDVFRRLGEGHPTRRIAEELNVSQKTVQAYCARIKIKLGLADSSQLARAAVRWSEQQRA